MNQASQNIRGDQFELRKRLSPSADLETSYTLMPSMGFYRESSMEEGMTQASNGLEFSEIEKVGSEDVNGHASTRYKTRFSDNGGKGEGFIWVTDTGVPIKMDMLYSSKDAQGQRMNIQFTELNLRDQDPSFFEVPSDLKLMSFGLAGGVDAASAVYAPGASAEDIAAATQSMGVTQADVERCRQP